MKPENCFIIGLILTFVSKSYSNSCINIPETPYVINNRYTIEISGNPKGYAPNENYTITLIANPNFLEGRFTEFTLVVESQDSFPGRSAGNFHLIDKHLTTFNPKCPLTVTHTSTITKKSIDVLWQAPPEDSDCVVIKAIVIENVNEWYVDGDLVKVLCQADEENEDTLPKILEICNACSEAKYEVAFQGLWSRNTHPKDFPDDMWTTKLGNVIGASHKYQKSFWDQATFASPGLKLLAEEGNTSLLETELKDMLKNDDIRTIIKARELAHPKITGTSYTVFRVDSENHLISLVSKITPSPDWIVGVSNLDMCLENGSWATSYAFNLYPWDVGTDDGLTYMSPDEPSTSPQLIRPIKSNIPNREESPFYKSEGGPIKPLAKLHLVRKKLYEKDCNPSVGENEDKIICPVTDWSQWSSCSATCGKGVRTRDRKFLHSRRHSCVKDESINLQETEECDNGEVCDETETTTLEDDCPNTMWAKWSPCSVFCGNGTKERYRINMYDEPNNDEADEDNEDIQESSCKNVRETVDCYNPPCTFGDVKSEGQVRFVPDDPVIDCEVTKWSVWSSCDLSLPCRKRFRYRTRYVLTPAQNGGKECPMKLRKKRRCPCKRGKFHLDNGVRPTSNLYTYYR